MSPALLLVMAVLPALTVWDPQVLALPAVHAREQHRTKGVRGPELA